MKLTVTISFLLVSIMVTPRAWADLSDDIQTLVGIRSVGVVVDSLDEPGADRIALPGEIRTGVELRLRQVGLRVVPVEELRAQAGSPFVHVIVQAVTQTAGDNKLGYFYVAQVELYQWASLVRKPTISASSVTWESRGKIGYVDLQEPEKVREAVWSQVDEFLNAYLAANPRPSR